MSLVVVLSFSAPASGQGHPPVEDRLIADVAGHHTAEAVTGDVAVLRDMGREQVRLTRFTVTAAQEDAGDGDTDSDPARAAGQVTGRLLAFGLLAGIIFVVVRSARRRRRRGSAPPQHPHTADHNAIPDGPPQPM